MPGSENYDIARTHMVDCQLRPNKITDDRVVDAMSAVARELFVPRNLRGVAYMDEDIEIAAGRFLLEPMVFAKMLQAAEIGTSDIVLDVGCATGYSAAVIGQLAGTVVALECDPDLAAKAGDVLNELEVDNVVVVEGELEAGLADQGPYNVILLNGTVARVPDPLLAQLAEGGRLVGVASTDGVGRIVVVERRDGLICRRDICDAACRRLPGFEPEAAFHF